MQRFSFSLTWHSSIGSSGRVEGGARNMKSMWSPLAAIFFMTCLYRAGGAWPLGTPWIRYCTVYKNTVKNFTLAAPIGTARDAPLAPFMQFSAKSLKNNPILGVGTTLRKILGPPLLQAICGQLTAVFWSLSEVCPRS